jgi:hypothetical protein
MYMISSNGPGMRRNARERNARAEVVIPAPALEALIAGNAWLDGDSISYT